MKILAISNYVGKPEDKQDSAIHLWRIKRPMLELQKNVDWQIDFQPSIIRDFKGYELKADEFIKDHGLEEVKHLGQYDIVFTSYFTSPHIYTLLWAASKKYGTKFIIDFDDDLFDVDPGNFAYWKSAGAEGHDFLNTIAKVAPYVCTTNDKLAAKFKQKSGVDTKVTVIPNYISDMYPDKEVDNGDKIVIGFFGGASHYLDLHKSGVLQALEKLMIEKKNVYFKICGQPVDHYLPRKRITEVDTANGILWPTERLPSMNLDIAVAPLLVTEFNQHKSDIKWQEATRMGSVFVGTNTGAYSTLDPSTAVLVRNDTYAWYEALKSLVEDADKRKTLVKNAKKKLLEYRLEDNWTKYKQMFEEVAND